MRKRRREFRTRDGLVVLVFVVLAVASQLGRWKLFTPFIALESDAANIASYAAAQDFPEFFTRDSALSQAEDLRFYATIHEPILRLLRPLTGDYGTAFISLLGLHLLLQCFGFYLLGRVLFRDRIWAFFLAMINVAFVPLMGGMAEYWGAWLDPQPRFTFQALLPFVLCLAIHWRDRTDRWPYLMALVGLLVYVHPVSTPAWGFAIWLGLWSKPNTEEPWRRVMTYRVLSAAAFLVVIAPFAVLYLGSRDAGETPAQVAAALRQSIPTSYQDATVALRRFLQSSTRYPFGALPIWSGIAVILLWLLGAREREILKRVLFWAVGILTVAVGITLADQSYAARAGTFPVQIDLIRNIRYFVPLLLLWPLAAGSSRIRENSSTPVSVAARGGLLAVGATIVFCWTATHTLPTIRPGLDCWLTGRISCEAGGAWRLERDAYDAVRKHTTPEDLIAASSHILAARMRFYALRSAANCGSDLSVLLYARQSAIPGWLVLFRRQNKIRALEEPDARFSEYLKFATDVGADYALLQRRYFPKGKFRPVFQTIEGHELVWRNGEFALVRLER